MFRVIFIAFLLIFRFESAKAGIIPGIPGEVVYDPSAATNALLQITTLKNQLENQIKMLEQMGKGEFTPEAIDFLNSQTQKCGFTKFSLPDLGLPPINLNICQNPQHAFDSVLKSYRTKIFPEKKDSPAVMRQKNEKRQELILKNAITAISKADLNIKSDPIKKDNLAKLTEGIKKSKNQNETLKLIAEINKQQLAEQQEQTLMLSFLVRTLNLDK